VGVHGISTSAGAAWLPGDHAACSIAGQSVPFAMAKVI